MHPSYGDAFIDGDSLDVTDTPDVSSVADLDTSDFDYDDDQSDDAGDDSY